MNERYSPTDLSDIIHCGEAQRCTATKPQEIVIGGGVQIIQANEDEVIVGSNGIISKTQPSGSGFDPGMDDPKFNGFGGIHPNFEK